MEAVFDYFGIKMKDVLGFFKVVKHHGRHFENNGPKSYILHIFVSNRVSKLARLP